MMQNLRLAIRPLGKSPGFAFAAIVALVLTRFLSPMLVGISAHGPLTFVAIALLLVIVARLVPARPTRHSTRLPRYARRSGVEVESRS